VKEGDEAWRWWFEERHDERTVQELEIRTNVAGEGTKWA
jgi:hypothetical protein